MQNICIMKLGQYFQFIFYPLLFMLARYHHILHRSFLWIFLFFELSTSWTDIILSTSTVERTGNCSLNCSYLFSIIPFLVNITVYNANKFSGDSKAVLLLTLEANDISLLNSSHQDAEIDIVTDISNRWASFMKISHEIAFWELKKGKIISLPDKIEAMTITLQKEMTDDVEAFVSMVWLDNNYIKYYNFWRNPIQCSVPKSLVSFYRQCLSISSYASSRTYLLYSQQFNVSNFTVRHNLKMYNSWRNASKLCSLSHGHLPEFSSKEELDELLALLKLSPEIHPIEALFIGLRSSQQVSLS